MYKLCLVCLTILGCCAAATAQVPAQPLANPPQPLPGIPLTPPAISTPLTPPANSTPLPDPALVPTPLPNQSGIPVTDPLLSPQPFPGQAPFLHENIPTGPLPGSMEEDFSKELAARDGFRMYTWSGGSITAFPTTLLWEPAIAVKKDPRMQVLGTTLSNYRTNMSINTSIGGTQGLWRLQTAGSDLEVQVDIFGVVHTMHSPEDLMAEDYRVGLPITFRRGNWQMKIGYEHTSAHVGDEFIRAQGRMILPYSRDEVVLGLGHIFNNSLRVYGHLGYAFKDIVPIAGRDPVRGDLGFEYFNRCPTGYQGTPYAAANIEWRGDQDYHPNLNMQVGWLWRNPYARLSNYRIFAEYYTGKSPFGQMDLETQSYAGVGFAFDY